MSSNSNVLVGVASLYTMLAISPGPNFLVITQAAVEGAKRQALLIALGVSTASILWASIAALGLGYMFGDFPSIRLFLQFLGGGYLVYLGVGLVRRSSLVFSASGSSIPASSWRCYLRGLLTNLANPKTLLFFASLFAGLFTVETDETIRLFSVVIVAAISLGWNILMVTIFSNMILRDGYRQFKYWIDNFIGIAMIFFGSRLLYAACMIVLSRYHTPFYF